MSSLNLFGKEWRNIVFDGRNKSYGAYKLREESGKHTLLALFIGTVIMGIAFGSSYLYASKSSKPVIEYVFPDDKPVLPSLHKDDPKPEPEPVKKNNTTAEKTVAAARTSVQKEIDFREVKIEKDENVKTNRLAAQDQFNDTTTSGQKDHEADTQNGELKKNGEATGNSHKENKKVKSSGSGESTSNALLKIVQTKAEPVEGYSKFYDRFIQKFSAQDRDSNAEIIIKLRFVVEKDGSFTNIEIIDDQMGLGEEAKRVLKAMPKWKPAEHNGRTVRSLFTLPIKIRTTH